jgi:hypothetical protein
MFTPYKTKMYKVRNYGHGKFIALPIGAEVVEFYECYEHPITGTFVYTPIKVGNRFEPTPVEESFYEQE